MNEFIIFFLEILSSIIMITIGILILLVAVVPFMELQIEKIGDRMEGRKGFPSFRSEADLYKFEEADVQLGIYSYVKRIIETIFSLFASVLFFPTIISGSIYLKMNRKGRLFYRKNICGYGGTVIAKMYFGGYIDGNIMIGNVFARSGAYKIPQLWQVVKGDLSLVGLSSHYEGCTDLESKELLNYERPGVFCLAYLFDCDYDERRLYDRYYLENRSAFLDLSIIFTACTKKVRFQESNNEENGRNKADSSKPEINEKYFKTEAPYKRHYRIRKSYKHLYGETIYEELAKCKYCGCHCIDKKTGICMNCGVAEEEMGSA